MKALLMIVLHTTVRIWTKAISGLMEDNVRGPIGFVNAEHG